MYLFKVLSTSRQNCSIRCEPEGSFTLPRGASIIAACRMVCFVSSVSRSPASREGEPELESSTFSSSAWKGREERGFRPATVQGHLFLYSLFREDDILFSSYDQRKSCTSHFRNAQKRSGLSCNAHSIAFEIKTAKGRGYYLLHFLWSLHPWFVYTLERKGSFDYRWSLWLSLYCIMATGRIKQLQDDLESVQKKTFTKWINSHLSKVSRNLALRPTQPLLYVGWAASRWSF